MPACPALMSHVPRELRNIPFLLLRSAEPRAGGGKQKAREEGIGLLLISLQRREDGSVQLCPLALTFSTLALCSAVKTRTKDKYRVVYTDHQRLELEKEFHYSRYITIRRKAELASNLGLSERQVCPESDAPRVAGLRGGGDARGQRCAGAGMLGGRDAWGQGCAPGESPREGDTSPASCPPHSPVQLPAGENLVPEQAGEGEEDQQEEAAASAARRRRAPQPQRLLAGSRGGGGRSRAGPRCPAVTAAEQRHRDCWRTRRIGPGRGHGGSGLPDALHCPAGPAVCTGVQCMCLVVRGKRVHRFINIIIIMSGCFFYPGIC